MKEKDYEVCDLYHHGFCVSTPCVCKRFKKDKVKDAAPVLLDIVERLLSLRDLIEYPDNVAPEHEGEAMAIRNLILKAEGIINKLKI